MAEFQRTSSVSFVGLSSGGQTAIVAGQGDDGADILDVSSGESRHHFQSTGPFALSADDRHLAVGREIWDAASAKMVCRLPSGPKPNCMAFSPDGTALVLISSAPDPAGSRLYPERMLIEVFVAPTWSCVREFLLDARFSHPVEVVVGDPANVALIEMYYQGGASGHGAYSSLVAADLVRQSAQPPLALERESEDMGVMVDELGEVRGSGLALIDGGDQLVVYDVAKQRKVRTLPLPKACFAFAGGAGVVLIADGSDIVVKGQPEGRPRGPTRDTERPSFIGIGQGEVIVGGKSGVDRLDLRTGAATHDAEPPWAPAGNGSRADRVPEEEGPSSGRVLTEERPDHCNSEWRLDSPAGGIHNITGLMWFMPSTVRPGERVQCTVRWAIERNSDDFNPNAVIHVNVFGDWRPDDELAHLIEGELMGRERPMERAFAFTAPAQPGMYRVRWMYITWFHPITSFYGGRNEPRDNCSPVAWSETTFRVEP